MSERLLPTKLFMPPARPHLVPRPRLINQLNQGRDVKLTLVSAPAGFGKTTLVTTWLGQQKLAGDEIPAAWLSLDENDNTFPRFFSYFIAAMQTVYPDLAQGLLSSLNATPPPDDDAVLPALLHELSALDRPLVVALDDYHVISNEGIHEALSKLVDYMPPTLRLLITTRAAPPLPLSRWRARGQLLEIRAADLRFTAGETGAFLQQTMGLDLDQASIATLGNRAEGWVAGLQLAALSLQGAADTPRFIAEFSGSDRHVADYLLQEVLYHQPSEVQDFLLRTSILERFCAELCALIIAPSEQIVDLVTTSQEILEHLERANLFLIPLDARRRWYRYHHLFAQLLQDRLRRQYDQASINGLHSRASRWFASNDSIEEAVYHATEGEDFDEAARLIATIPTDTLWDRGNTTLFKRWGQLIPTDSLRRHPRSLVAIAAAYLITGDIHRFNHFLSLCAGIDSIYGEYALLKCTLVRNEGDFGRALYLAQESGEYLPEEDTTLRAVALMQIVNNLLRLGDLDQAERASSQARALVAQAGEANPNIHVQAIQLQGAVALMRADFYQAHRLYHEGLALAERATAGTPPMVGMMYAELGRVHYEWNELAESAAHYAKARSWADRTGISDILVAALIGEIELLCQQGRAPAVEPKLEALRDYARRGRLQDMVAQTESMIALYHLRLGKLDEAIRWANASGHKLTDRPDGTQRFFCQALVAVRLAECRATGIKDNLPQMSALLTHLLQQAQAGQYRHDMIELLLQQTLLFEYQGDGPSSHQALRRALDLAKPGSLVRTFLDKGPDLASILAQTEGAYARRLYQASRLEARGRESDNGAADSLNLTPREYEVLREIAAGLSNKEIEEKLVISRNTVRTHIKNLYGKLGVSSRTRAIKKARELKLI